jgi:TRAP-type C4-dicarboxylate transport system substrate-binding protein
MLIISTKVWKSLSPEFQQLLQQAADESVEYQRKIWTEAEQKDMKTMIDAGVKVSAPDKELFRQSVKSVWDEFADTEIGSLIQNIQEVCSVEKN